MNSPSLQKEPLLVQNMPKNPNQNKPKGSKRPRENADQDISAPAAKSRKVIVREPTMMRGPMSHRIVHRELLATISGSVAFATNSYVINPGLSSSFPWLATQAAGWEQYRFFV